MLRLQALGEINGDGDGEDTALGAVLITDDPADLREIGHLLFEPVLVLPEPTPHPYDGLFVIEVHPHHRAGRGRFYGPNRCGYTDNPRRAGVYTEAEAEAETRAIPHLTYHRVDDVVDDMDHRRPVQADTVGALLGRCW